MTLPGMQAGSSQATVARVASSDEVAVAINKHSTVASTETTRLMNQAQENCQILNCKLSVCAKIARESMTTTMEASICTEARRSRATKNGKKRRRTMGNTTTFSTIGAMSGRTIGEVISFHAEESRKLAKARRPTEMSTVSSDKVVRLVEWAGLRRFHICALDTSLLASSC